MNKYRFKVESMFYIGSCGETKEEARQKLLEEIKEGKLDKDFGRYIKVSKGSKAKW